MKGGFKVTLSKKLEIFRELERRNNERWGA